MPKQQVLIIITPNMTVCELLAKQYNRKSVIKDKYPQSFLNIEILKTNAQKSVQNYKYSKIKLRFRNDGQKCN